MKRIPAVKTVMTPFPYSVDAGAPVAEAQDFMRQHRIRHLPVVHDGQLAGVISDRDIKLVLGPDFAYPNAGELTVRDVMVQDPYVVDLGTRLDEVLEHMATHQLGSALVTREGRLAGVFTVTDACRAFAQHLREQFRRAGGGGDAA
jgi:CBS domain-containing protein